MVSGVLIIDKPQGWTSHDVVAKLRGILGEKRIGHGGTLDPMATGVLPVFAGRATRAVEFASETEKEYIATLRLGLTTDTQDITGTVLEERPVKVTAERLERALAPFRGEIMQVPPMYSAVKQDGKKLYELARAGIQVDRRPRRVTIHSLELGEQISSVEYVLRVVCSKGTYVRTLCHDIGQALQCGAAMSALRRTRAGGFGLDGAYTVEQVASSPQPRSLLLPVDVCFARYPSLTVTGAALAKVKNGNAVLWHGEPGVYRVYDPSGGFLMLGQAENGRLLTIKSFFEV
jgi:tRNA pseudouridine55 synthase